MTSTCAQEGKAECVIASKSISFLWSPHPNWQEQLAARALNLNADRCSKSTGHDDGIHLQESRTLRGGCAWRAGHANGTSGSATTWQPREGGGHPDSEGA